jgi:hypothetical protein
MLVSGVINPSKKGTITSNVFHLFYSNESTSYLFDSARMDEPIIFGNKSLVLSILRKINTLMVIGSPDTKVFVYSYIMTSEGYKRKITFNGPISGIGRNVPLL